MMKKLLLLFATISSLIAKAQTSVYHPFPDSGAVWNVTNKWNDGTYIHYYFESLYYPGSVISANGNTYHELWVSGMQADFFLPFGPMTYFPPYNQYTGTALRSDSALHRVYRCCGFPQEIIFIDFNFQVGDTLSAHGTGLGWGSTFTINSIDSILIDTSYRKKYNFLDFCSANASIIEGIGSTGGLFWEPFCFEHGGYLNCFSLFNNQLFRVFNSTPCGVLAVDEISKSNNLFEVFPNPFNDKLNFTFKSEGVNEIILYDLASRKLLQQQFSNTVSLNTEQLSKGLYLYEVRNKNGLCKKGKIVKD